MTDLNLDCTACGKKFRISFAVKPKQVTCPQCKAKVSTAVEAAPVPAAPAAAPAAVATPLTPAVPAPATPAPAITPASAPAPAPAPAAVEEDLPLLSAAAPASAAAVPALAPVLAPVLAPAVAAPVAPAAVPAAATAAPATPAPAAAASGAKLAAKSPAKPRRLPELLNSEEVEFKGWTYDREAEQVRHGLQKADVLGVVWIGGVLVMVGFILFRLLKSKIPGEVVMGLGTAGLAVAGYLFLQLKKKPSDTACIKCQGALGLVHTVPTERDCKAGNYLRGASGRAYRLESTPAPKVWEIRRTWHVCKACKRYFLAEKEFLDFVGGAKADMEKREALYAEAAAAAAPKPA